MTRKGRPHSPRTDPRDTKALPFTEEEERLAEFHAALPASTVRSARIAQEGAARCENIIALLEIPDAIGAHRTNADPKSPIHRFEHQLTMPSVHRAVVE
jgi:hypothetical protein